MKSSILLLFIFPVLVFPFFVNAQQETLIKCTNHEARSWWDTREYNLFVDFNLSDQSIEGSVIIRSDIVQTAPNLMQIDLQQPMEITSAELIEPVISSVKFARINAYSYALTYNFGSIKSSSFTVRINFKGSPRRALNAPWDGGFVYSKDSLNNHWWAVACQGIGASVWFPCKDAPFDEPEKVTLNYTVPENYMALGNGMLKGYSYNDSLKNINFSWQINNPVNLYNITFYIGKYTQLNDTFRGKNGALPISYFCLRGNEEKAKKQFKQVIPMLECFEEKIGAYPFYEDGFKLVESPYLGMEHQSAIAYGNQYRNGYLGMDRSGSGVGLLFDFIIVHESGHEWFGNSITASDKAFTWIQEGFTTYTETIFAECRFGKQQADKYQRGKRKTIKNDKPAEGIPMQCNSGSGDHYEKAAYMVHTLRTVMQDDAKFYRMLRKMTDTFRHSIVDGKTVEQFLLSYADGKINTTFFDQYLRTTKIPKLVIEKEKYGYYVHWQNTVPEFTMPVNITVDDKIITVSPTARAILVQDIPLESKKISVSEDYLVDVQLPE